MKIISRRIFLKISFIIFLGLGAGVYLIQAGCSFDTSVPLVGIDPRFNGCFQGDDWDGIVLQLNRNVNSLDGTLITGTQSESGPFTYVLEGVVSSLGSAKLSGCGRGSGPVYFCLYEIKAFFGQGDDTMAIRINDGPLSGILSRCPAE